MNQDPLNRHDNPYLTEVYKTSLVLVVAVYAVTYGVMALLLVTAVALATLAGWV